ncbi:interleukin-1 receptor-associated kinase 1-binding protein 1 homolog [Montipora capricornis]|uniref:interleukin-1 receptor-associated kinase 1-binding protein 1 homolog n=1 Tax=Montipora capricornis TaxID=246305 RepID=UPI0035F14DCA
MSRLESKKHSPAHVFAQFSSLRENEGGNGANNGCKHEGSPGNRREIQITESGEVSLPPDMARVSIVCTNAKESVEEVKTSVNRRVDYVLQTLKSYHIKEYKMHKSLEKVEKLYRLEVEVVVDFGDFSKCEQVCNILVEKLDDTVKVSSPELYHSPGRLDSQRRQACVCAVRNARNKALEVVQMFNQSLGPPLFIREEQFDEFVGSTNTESVHGERTPEEQMTFQQRVTLTTVTVNVKIFIVFEIREKAKTRKRK